MSGDGIKDSPVLRIHAAPKPATDYEQEVQDIAQAPNRDHCMVMRTERDDCDKELEEIRAKFKSLDLFESKKFDTVQEVPDQFECTRISHALDEAQRQTKVLITFFLHDLSLSHEAHAENLEKLLGAYQKVIQLKEEEKSIGSRTVADITKCQNVLNIEVVPCLHDCFIALCNPQIGGFFEDQAIAVGLLDFSGAKEPKKVCRLRVLCQFLEHNRAMERFVSERLSKNFSNPDNKCWYNYFLRQVKIFIDNDYAFHYDDDPKHGYNVDPLDDRYLCRAYTIILKCERLLESLSAMGHALPA